MVVAATAAAANGVLLVVNLSIYQNWLLLFLFSSLFLSRFVWNFQWLQLINHNDNIRVDVYVWASVCVFVYFVLCIIFFGINLYTLKLLCVYLTNASQNAHGTNGRQYRTETIRIRTFPNPRTKTTQASINRHQIGQSMFNGAGHKAVTLNSTMTALCDVQRSGHVVWPIHLCLIFH